MHSDIAMPYISEYGTQEQIQKFIPDMTAGKIIGALAMTEPSAGRWETLSNQISFSRDNANERIEIQNNISPVEIRG